VGSPRHSSYRNPRRSLRERHHREFHPGGARPRLCAGDAGRPDPGFAQPAGFPVDPRSAATGARLRRANRRDADQRAVIAGRIAWRAAFAVKVVNWNVQWAARGSVRSPEILHRIERHGPDIVCLTETDCRLLLTLEGHTIVCRSVGGKAAGNNQRKVLLWSQRPWSDVDDIGSEALPPGRFIAGATETPEGPVKVVGVCVPWHNANVNVGDKNKTPWEDHSAYLSSLSSILGGQSPTPLIVMGDFNQQIGQRRRAYPPLSHPVRHELREAMEAAKPAGLTIVTAGLGLRGRRAIDHIAISGDLSARSLTTIDNMDGDRRLSDHFGVVADLSTSDAPQNPLQKSDRYDNQQSSTELATHRRA